MTMIASIGPDIPLQVLAATGRFAGPLGWAIDRPFPRAGQWLESKFAPWAFSILEDWAAGAFDHLETVVFSRADDNAQRLYYYACELRRRGLIAGPEPLLFDLALIARSTSEARTIEAVRALAARLGVSDETLAAQLAAPAAVSPAAKGSACLIAGTPPPDRRLHAMVESAGLGAAGETLEDIWSRSVPVSLAPGEDPCEALGRALHLRQQGPRGFYDRGAALVGAARAAGAAGVILWYCEEDEAQVWHLPAQQLALAETGFPALVLTRRNWRADDGVAAEIAGFVKGLAA